MSNSSKKHHFIPVFYQKGFLSKEGELFALKKSHGGIKNWSPSQIMYVKNLHTINLRDESTVMIEEFYSQIEGLFNKYLMLITENIKNPDLITGLTTDGDFQRIAKLMVAIQFWRTPCREKLAQQYSGKLLELYDKADGEIKDMVGKNRRFIRFICKRSRKDDSIKVIQFLLLPLLTFDISTKAVRLKIFKSNSRKKFVTSDRPVLFDNIEELFSLKSFLFPFTKDLLLVGAEKDINLLDIDKVNKLITSRASEVVISGEKQQLENLISLPNKHVEA